MLFFYHFFHLLSTAKTNASISLATWMKLYHFESAFINSRLHSPLVRRFQAVSLFCCVQEVYLIFRYYLSCWNYSKLSSVASEKDAQRLQRNDRRSSDSIVYFLFQVAPTAAGSTPFPHQACRRIALHSKAERLPTCIGCMLIIYFSVFVMQFNGTVL